MIFYSKFYGIFGQFIACLFHFFSDFLIFCKFLYIINTFIYTLKKCDNLELITSLVEAKNDLNPYDNLIVTLGLFYS